MRAPGRVNLIGEHTDYNDGFVLPIAIDRELWIAMRPRTDGRVRLHSLDFDHAADFHPDALSHADEGWAEYVKGVAWALRESGHAVMGLEGVIGGDLPRAAGLSSSAALEMATLRAFAAAADEAWNPVEAARIGQRVENAWLGLSSGIMDQLVVAAGRRDHALLIDCRTLAIEPVSVPREAAVIVLDTGTRRGLVDSAYNERRQECEAAARAFGVAALRDVSLATFAARSKELDPKVRRRAQHVVSENQRTLEAADALRSGDLPRLGQLMNASHASLRSDFEVTNDALDAIAEIAQHQPTCFGARMTGAGFGGCAVAVVKAESADAFIHEVCDRYRAVTGIEPTAYRCRAADGASVEATV